jgi:hypothetical protein
MRPWRGRLRSKLCAVIGVYKCRPQNERRRGSFKAKTVDGDWPEASLQWPAWTWGTASRRGRSMRRTAPWICAVTPCSGPSAADGPPAPSSSVRSYAGALISFSSFLARESETEKRNRDIYAVYELFKRMAYYGIASNLVIYLTDKLHQGSVEASNNVTNWSGTVFLTPLLGAYVIPRPLLDLRRRLHHILHGKLASCCMHARALH